MPESDKFSFSRAARADFEDAVRKGFWRSVISWLTKHSNELLPFDEVRKRLPLRGQHYIGLRQVNLDHIIGSVSRYQDFDRAFLPRQSHTRERWESVDRAHLQDVILPPIELYKLGNVYFVKDGNHRVSVAREKGQVFIDAYVIEIDIPVSLESDLELHDLVLKQEQAQFYSVTGLLDIHPDADIGFSVPGQYSKLIEHIRVHRWYMGEELEREITDKEAVDGWYEDVYLPLIKIIRKRNILAEFRGRTEADLYLWILEHRFYLKEEYKRDVSLEKAAVHFTSEYAPKPFRHLRNWIKNGWQKIFKPDQKEK